MQAKNGERLIIDRFEGEYAVCEDESGHTHDYARVELPRQAKEGDVLRWDAHGTLAVDTAETKARREKAQQQLRALLGDD